MDGSSQAATPEGPGAEAPGGTLTPEIELKLELDAAALDGLQRHPALAAPPQVLELTSVYFDTPDHRLHEAGVSLRVRRDGEAFVQTIKWRRSSGLFEREELEIEVPGERPDPAVFEQTPVAALLDDGAEVSEVCATRVRRVTRLWRDGESLIEISLDEGEVVAGEAREPIAELELELKAGRPQALFALARALGEAAPLRLAFESKGERGYRLAAGDGRAARKAEPVELGEGDTAADAWRAIALNALRQVSLNARAFRTRPGVAALHQTRVGLRRLRAAFSLFKPILGGETLERMKAEARWAAGELADGRDLDVFLRDAYQPAAERSPADPAMAALGARLLAARDAAYARASQALASRRLADWLLDLTEWIEVGDWLRQPDPKIAAMQAWPVRDFADLALARRARFLKKDGDKLGKLDAPRRHALRVKVKKLRYAFDFFGELYGGDAGKAYRKQLAMIRALQDGLGELNDEAVAAEVARAAVGSDDPGLLFAAGRVAGRREQLTSDVLSRTDRAWRALRATRSFWR
ncbi:MAG TPA: CHAD domain-containing protein [Phenylobacterium sp.]|nr:CHAD domain-containing protein [Phenylobacterium sp.]